MNILSLAQALRNPQQFMQNVMSNNQIMSNPLAQNAVSMMQKRDTDGLKKMAENLCKEYGTSVEEVKGMIQKNIGM